MTIMVIGHNHLLRRAPAKTRVNAGYCVTAVASGCERRRGILSSYWLNLNGEGMRWFGLLRALD
jgi:hypothetical protein